MTPKKPARRAPQALAAKPVAGRPVAGKPVAGKPFVGNPMTARAMSGKAAASAPAAPKAAKAIAPVKSVSMPAAAAPSVAKPAVSKSPVAKSQVGKPSVAKPSVAKPPVPESIASRPSVPERAPMPAPHMPAAKAAQPVAAPPAAIVATPAPVSAPLRQFATPAVEPVPAPAAKPVPVVDAASIASAVKAAIPPEALPKAVRGVADAGLAQARDAYATMKHSAETLSSGLNTSGEAAARGLKSLSTTMLEQMQTNADATLGFMRAMAGVKTLSEAIELQARHARQQFDTVTAQAKALAGIMNKTASETTEPMRKVIDASIRRAS
ncbi:MAG: phasin family protein [Burkholderiales bacterium]|nr:phasin family protein [Burkholderiales bacterium]